MGKRLAVMFQKSLVYAFTFLLAVQAYGQLICLLNSSDKVEWRLFPVDKVSATVSELSAPGFDVSAWIPSKKARNIN